MQVDAEALLDLLPDLVVVMEPDSTISYANAAVTRLLGWTSADLIGRSSFDFVHPDEQSEAVAQIAAQLDDPASTRRHHVELAHRDGGFVKFEMLASFDPDAHGRFLLVLRDVSESAEVQKRLHRSDEQLRALTENVPDALARFDAHAILVFETRRFREMVMANAGLVDMWTEHAEAVLATGELLDVEHAIADQARWVAVRFVPERGPDGALTHVLVIATDITDRRENELRLIQVAHHDALTGLFNRQRFRELAERVLARAADPDDRAAADDAGVALVFLDLDEFKSVNDRYGHAVGDAVLVEVARRLVQVVRPQDSVARFGGDEFVVLCHDIGRSEADEIATRIADAIAVPIADSGAGAALAIGASVGVATGKHGSTNLDHLLGQADAAMYRVKAEHPNHA